VSSILGIDLGSRRIGIAIAEAGALSARPLSTIARTGDELTAISELVHAHDVIELVVGLPLEAHGAEGPMAVGARAWAAAVGRELGLPVHLRDERLSSSLAESRLGPMPRGRSGGPPSPTQRERYRARVDREAAAVILQDELDARRTAGR
jgi:putative Holliday junction resolvase